VQDYLFAPDAGTRIGTLAARTRGGAGRGL